MANRTAITWTDLTWNPVHGCSIVSTECRNCYAMTLSLRHGQTSKPWTPANAAENVLLKAHKLREPLSGAADWKGLGDAARAAGKTEGKLVFVNSMSDLFHEQVPMVFVARVFAAMALSPQHTFQILTKRPERMRNMVGGGEWPDNVHAQARQMVADPTLRMPAWASEKVEAWEGFLTWPLPNVWLGVSVGNRHFVSRADLLRQTPAAVRFISAEPLLGPLIYDTLRDRRDAERHADRLQIVGSSEIMQPAWADGHDGPELDLTDIDWLIVGGESGPDHRPMDLQWACDLYRATRRPCNCRPGMDGGGVYHDHDCPAFLNENNGTAFFFKQESSVRPGQAASVPSRLVLREFPHA